MHLSCVDVYKNLPLPTKYEATRTIQPHYPTRRGLRAQIRSKGDRPFDRLHRSEAVCDLFREFANTTHLFGLIVNLTKNKGPITQYSDDFEILMNSFY